MKRVTLTLPLITVAGFASIVPAFGQEWHERAITTNPTARELSASALDPNNGDLIIFGGRSFSTTLDDTMRFDGFKWAPVTQSTPRPSGRYDFDMAQDQARGEIVLFGGLGASGVLADTWEFNGTNWSAASPAVSPPARRRHSMAYDAGSGVVILFGGVDVNGTPLGDTWSYDGVTWTDLMPVVSPTPREGQAMAFDHNLGQVVLFGGFSVAAGWSSETWAFDVSANAWVLQTPAAGSPAAREGHAMTFDESRGTMVMSGGAVTGNTIVSDVWEWDGATWNTLVASISPVARTEHVLEYGPRGELVAFGGAGGTGVGSRGDTWTFRSLFPFGLNAPLRRDQSVPDCPSATLGLLPTLTSDTGATLGSSFDVDLKGFDPSFPVVALSFGFAPTTPVACTAFSHVSAATTTLGTINGEAMFSLTVPMDPSLIGVAMFAQAVSIDQNGTSLYFTNQGIVVIGS